MSKPPKVFRHNDVLFVTTSVEQGILLPSNPLLNLIILSCLAHAQTLYRVRVTAFIVEGTHLHMILVVVDPEDVSRFMRSFKTESAHLINRLLGRRKRTVWCESFDAPVLLTPDDVVNKILYLYCNPVKDGLVSTIAEYPGLSSWQAHQEGKTRTWRIPRLLRPRVRSLPNGRKLKRSDYQRMADALVAEAPCEEAFVVEPFSWMEAFGLSREEQKLSHEGTVRDLRTEENSYRSERSLMGKGFVGAERLSDSGFDLSYVPSRSGKRTVCISSNRELRTRFITWVRGLRQEARRVFSQWRLGDFSSLFPSGLFPPGLPKQSNLVPALVRF